VFVHASVAFAFAVFGVVVILAVLATYFAPATAEAVVSGTEGTPASAKRPWQAVGSWWLVVAGESLRWVLCLPLVLVALVVVLVGVLVGVVVMAVAVSVEELAHIA
jgi:hypothetical protein